jgi:hypothetical protein
MPKKKQAPITSAYDSSKDKPFINTVSPFGSMAYDQATNSGITTLNNPELEQAKNAGFAQYNQAVQQNSNFLQNPSQDQYYNDYYVPNYQRDLDNRMGQFQANLGSRAQGTMGQLLSQQTAQQNAMQSAQMPFKYQQDVLFPRANQFYQLGNQAQESQINQGNALNEIAKTYNTGFSNFQNRVASTAQTAANNQIAQQGNTANTLGALASAYKTYNDAQKPKA